MEISESIAILGSVLSLAVLLAFSARFVTRSKSWRLIFQGSGKPLFSTYGRLLPTALAGTVGLVAAVTSMLGLEHAHTQSTILERVQEDRLTSEVRRAIERQVATLQVEVGALKKDTHSRANPFDARMSELQQRTTRVEESIRRLDGLVMTNPERLISLPIIQRDLELIKDDMAALKESMKLTQAVLAESGSQNRWLLGGVGLAIIGLFIQQLMQFRSSSHRKN